MTAIAVIFGTTVLIQISTVVDLMVIFQGMGIFTIIVGAFLIFGIKDVISMRNKQKKADEEALQAAPKEKKKCM